MLGENVSREHPPGSGTDETDVGDRLASLVGRTARQGGRLVHRPRYRPLTSTSLWHPHDHADLGRLKGQPARRAFQSASPHVAESLAAAQRAATDQVRSVRGPERRTQELEYACTSATSMLPPGEVAVGRVCQAESEAFSHLQVEDDLVGLGHDATGDGCVRERPDEAAVDEALDADAGRPLDPIDVISGRGVEAEVRGWFHRPGSTVRWGSSPWRGGTRSPGLPPR